MDVTLNNIYLIKKGLFSLFIGFFLTLIVRKKIIFEYDLFSLSGSGPGFFSFITVFYFFLYGRREEEKFLVLNFVYFIYMFQEFMSIFGIIGVYSLSDGIYYSLAYIFIRYTEF